MGCGKWGKKSVVCVNDSFYKAKRPRAINAEKGGYIPEWQVAGADGNEGCP